MSLDEVSYDLGKFAQIANLAKEANIKVEYNFMQIENNTICMNSSDLAKLLDYVISTAAVLRAELDLDYNSQFLAYTSLEIMLKLKELGYRI